MNKRVWGTSFAVVATLLLAGCGVQTGSNASSSTATSTSSKVKQPADYLAAVKTRGLAVSDESNIDVHTLPAAVKATAGVKFAGASNTPMLLLTFSTQAAANTARSYYVGQNKHVYTSRNLLFVADYGLAKGWFEKYRRAIFVQ